MLQNMENHLPNGEAKEFSNSVLINSNRVITKKMRDRQFKMNESPYTKLINQVKKSTCFFKIKTCKKLSI